MASQEKNRRIRETRAETIQRHSGMTCRVYSVKVQDNKLNVKQREALAMMFVEAKWFKNHVLAWNRADANNKISNFDTKCRLITHKDKDMNDVVVELRYLPESVRQTICSKMLTDIKTLKTKKAQHSKVGQLHFVKEMTSLNFKQFGTTHKIVSPKRVKLAGIKKYIVVNGLEQFINEPGFEVANAQLIKAPNGYYINFTVYVPKEKPTTNGMIIGLDFGCTTTIATSEGEKIKVSVRESEYLKRLSKRNNKRLVKAFVARYGHKPDMNDKTDAHNFKTIEHSESWKRDNSKIRRQYRKLSNQKEDIANKLVARFKEYDTVVIQDEQLKAWHKTHGKTVQHSVLGRVKKKLAKKPNTVFISSTVATTKLCTECGEIHDEMTVRDRVFRCGCGVEEDRDIHAAQTMVWLYENNIGVGRTKFKRVETKALVDKAVALSIKPAV